MPDTAFNRDDINTMTSEGQRWHETAWGAVINRYEGASREQLMALMQGGIGQPESE